MTDDDKLRVQSVLDRVDGLFDDAERYSLDAWNAGEEDLALRWFSFAKSVLEARRVLSPTTSTKDNGR